MFTQGEPLAGSAHEQRGTTHEDQGHEQQSRPAGTEHPPHDTQRHEHRRQGEQHHARMLPDDRHRAPCARAVDFLCHVTRMPPVTYSRGRSCTPSRGAKP
ncbi:hypothetical protein MSMEI_4884 [Mycolicibacterium smegmatis MC2 155]|uniref:Trans-sialidase, putative n=2 Tax=Mycolicibacterium smegmatis (strain ATCC 700084 / mc(2)155) TaxID=246196 RepID=A0R274_MYCS2|nr:trans-sialidase, putative [Mycolicibacterium smegmatis MC2 155]AFP41328.1 hypothetical protein MSMEI_4884 [Mycolicibacterium smegmatis MC2 155]